MSGGKIYARGAPGRHSAGWETCTNLGALKENFRDAAEFEARVQRWLMYQYEKAFQSKEASGGFLPGRDTMLMFARLAVEEEMESRK